MDQYNLGSSELAGGKRSKVIAGRHGCSEESLRGNTGCHGNSSERCVFALCSSRWVGCFGGGGRQWEKIPEVNGEMLHEEIEKRN